MTRVFSCFLFLFLSSCGSLILSPQGCRSPGYWGTATEKSSELETKFSGEYYVLTVDKEVKLRDFLKEKGVACENVRKIRVRMSSVLFVKRTLDVYITKENDQDKFSRKN